MAMCRSRCQSVEMASDLTNAFIIGKQHLQQIVAAAVAQAWKNLPHYNQEQVDQFLTAALPVSAAANRQSVALTEAFLARSLGRGPLGVSPEEIIAGIRNGATPEEVFKRSFVTVWAALGNGTPWEQAVQMGLSRASGAAAMDVQLSFTHTLVAVGRSDSRIVGYERVPDAGACEFCRAASGQIYHSDQLAPLHNGCGCGAEPVTAADAVPFAPRRFSGPNGLEVAIRQHGELGPTLTNAAEHFAGPSAVHSH